MLELYNFAQSTCSQKVRICLAEKKLDFVDRVLVSKDQDHLSDWYLKLNPNGVVPTLIHDGTPIIESSVILQYLDDAFPEVPLTPADNLGKARMRAWLAFVDHVTTPAVRYPSFQHGGLYRKFARLSPQEFEANANKRPLKSAFYKRMKGGGFSDEDMANAIEDVRKTAVRMDRMLAESGGPWLMGAQYTLADICVQPLIDRMEDLGYGYLWEQDHPRVADWLARMRAREACVATYYPGTRLSEIYPDIKDEVARIAARGRATSEPAH
jgi:glutathione S-transferase